MLASCQCCRYMTTHYFSKLSRRKRDRLLFARRSTWLAGGKQPSSPVGAPRPWRVQQSRKDGRARMMQTGKLHLGTVPNGTCLVRNSLFDVILKGCLLRSGAFAAGAQI